MGSLFSLLRAGASSVTTASWTGRSSFLALALFAGAACAGCGDMRDIKMPKMPWDHPSIVQVAPKGPVVPLNVPKETLRGEKGPANAPYPASFTVTLKSDGTILFPEGDPGKVKGSSIFVGGGPVATLNADGEVSGSGLKRKYRFAPDGDLLDAQGRGVRLLPDGGVRAIGGPYRYKEVMQWSEPGKTPYDAKAPNQGPTWDTAAWRTVAIASLLMIENLLPGAIGR